MNTETLPFHFHEASLRPIRGRRSIHDKRKRSGFSVIEIMLAVVIIGLLAAIAIPAFQKIREQADIAKFISDLRTMSGQFEGYHFANAGWPAHTPAGELPPEVSGYVNEGSFIQPNSVGGEWKWYNTGGLVGLAVEYGATDRELILYQAIAERIDDGDFFDGRFKFGDSEKTLVWVLNE